MRRILGVWVAGLLVLTACSSGGGRVKDIAAPVGCSAVQTVELQGRDHVADGTTVDYKTDPPTSGDHFGHWQPPSVGVLTEPVQNEIQVHNLEHGHVIIQYQGLTAAEQKELLDVAVADPFMMLTAPRPSMKHKIALTAWLTIQTCDTVPANVKDVVRAFVRAHRDHAPESIPT